MHVFIHLLHMIITLNSRQLIVNVFKMGITITIILQILVKIHQPVKNPGVMCQNLRYQTCGELFIGLLNF